MDLAIYTRATYYLDSNTKAIKNLAMELSTGLKDRKDIVKSYFEYVRDNIKYSVKDFQLHNKEQFKASVTLQKKKSFCVPKAILLAALLRVNPGDPIPSRLHFVDIINHRSPKYLQDIMGTNVFVFHGYTEVYLDKWIKLTPSFDSELCKRHNLPICEFTGENDAIFSPKDNEGNPFVKYVNDYGTFDDLPYEQLVKRVSSYYKISDENIQWKNRKTKQ
ncbi:MAG: transglutaminase-like domain-containing protein [Candidatus Hodarchaeales archaeon]